MTKRVCLKYSTLEFFWDMSMTVNQVTKMNPSPRENGKLQLWSLWFDPWVGKIPGEGHGNPLQCSYLEKPHG